MLHRFCFAILAVFVSGVAFGAYGPQQVVTSEVFYDYGQENQENTAQEETVVEQRYENANYYEPTNVTYVEQQVIPVWPIAGTDADFKIACENNECADAGELKIVSKIGSGLVIENNINTKGTGWSGGANIYNGQQIPAGFDYECVNDAEMPLLRREMMEDDGGTVLSMSRSPRRICNKQPDSYIAFAERAGFVAEKTTQESVIQDGANVIINVNEDVDDEMPAFIENDVRSWVVASGETLQSVLKNWCDKEGWDLVWTTPREYPIEASAVFKGRFVDVASALVRNFERALPAPYAKFYKGNRVLVVSTME